MCLHPILLKNPNFGRDPRKGLCRFVDVTNTHISVPCGHCQQCIHTRQQKYIQRMQIEMLDSALYFFTLTYNDEHLPRFIHPKHGEIKHFRHSDIQNMFKRIRKRYTTPIRYLVASEYGTRKHRPHYHGIISVTIPPGLRPRTQEYDTWIYNTEHTLYNLIRQEWRINTGSTRAPVYEPLYTHYRTRQSYNYDLHYIETATDNNAIHYTTKYICKYDKWFEKFDTLLKKTLPHDEYIEIHRLITPRLLFSKSLGAINTPVRKQYIRKGIDTAKLQNFAYPLFIDHSGATHPLTKHYRKYVTVNDMEIILLNTQEHSDNHHDSTDETINDFTTTRKKEIQDTQHYKRILDKLEKKYE